MTKERAKEMWGEMGLIARSMSVATLIALAWAGLTAAKTGMETWFLPRTEYREHEAQRQSALELRALRDSARMERINSRLNYLICREDFPRQQCLRPDR
jgi:hypothetical protein